MRKGAEASPELGRLAQLIESGAVRDLLAGVFSGSPYLSGLIDRDLARLQRILTSVPEVYFEELKGQLSESLNQAASRSPLAATRDVIFTIAKVSWATVQFQSGVV